MDKDNVKICDEICCDKLCIVTNSWLHRSAGKIDELSNNIIVE